MSFSYVRISCFRAKAHLVFLCCLHNIFIVPKGNLLHCACAWCIHSRSQCSLRAYTCLPGSAPERPISVNPGLKFSVARFCILPSKVLLYLTRSKGSSVRCKLQLHARTQENFASNLVYSWVKPIHPSRNRNLVVKYVQQST